MGIGDSVGNRNSPVLFNLAFSPYLMMDGGVPTLELQVAAPLLHEGEMGFDLFELVKRLERNPLYEHDSGDMPRGPGFASTERHGQRTPGHPGPDPQRGRAPQPAALLWRLARG